MKITGRGNVRVTGQPRPIDDGPAFDPAGILLQPSSLQPTADVPVDVNLGWSAPPITNVSNSYPWDRPISAAGTTGAGANAGQGKGKGEQKGQSHPYNPGTPLTLEQQRKLLGQMNLRQ